MSLSAIVAEEVSVVFEAAVESDSEGGWKHSLIYLTMQPQQTGMHTGGSACKYLIV